MTMSDPLTGDDGTDLRLSDEELDRLYANAQSLYHNGLWIDVRVMIAEIQTWRELFDVEVVHS